MRPRRSSAACSSTTISPSSCGCSCSASPPCIIWLSLLTGIPDREDSADFYCLLLGATRRHVGHGVGQPSADGVHRRRDGQLAELCPGRLPQGPAAVERGSPQVRRLRRRCRRASCSTASACWPASSAPPTCPTGWPRQSPIGDGRSIRSCCWALLFILIGLSFKLAAVPFHFWCPDVFEGAAAEVAGFLSVASKGAALALLGRFALVLIGVGLASTDPSQPPPPRSLRRAISGADCWRSSPPLTATFGNLAAYPADQPQTAAGLLDHRPRRLS